MTRDTKFEEVFWDADYMGSQGFEVLLKKMKDGQKMCKDVEDFCKQRAKIEEEYAKGLRKLVRSMDGQTEIGTMRYGWDKVKEETEKIANEHFDVARQLSDQVNKLASCIEAFKNTKKAHEDTVKSSIKKRNDLYKKAVDSKKSYDAKCRDSETFDLQIESWRAQGHHHQMKPQEWEKQVSKQVKMQQDAEKAHKAYKDNIQLLEDIRMKWKQDMVNACKEYEKVEETRIAVLRNELWVHLNLLSQLYVNNDEHNEEVRKSLDKINIDTDIMQFIREKKVGNTCPSKHEYEPYVSPNTHQVRPIGGTKSDSLGSRPPPPLPSNPQIRILPGHAKPPPGPRYVQPPHQR